MITLTDSAKDYIYSIAVKNNKKIGGVIIPLPKPVIVTKIKQPKKSKFYS